MTVAPLVKHNSCCWLDSCCFSVYPRLFKRQKEKPFSSCFGYTCNFMGFNYVHRLHDVPNFWRSSGWINFEVNSYVGCLFWRSWSSCNCSYDFRSGGSCHGYINAEKKTPNRWHPKLTKILFWVLVVCFSLGRNSVHSALFALDLFSF